MPEMAKRLPPAVHKFFRGKRVPVEVLKFFRAQGAKGGRIGGKRSLETMTPEQRVARAKKASQAASAARERARRSKG